MAFLRSNKVNADSNHYWLPVGAACVAALLWVVATAPAADPAPAIPTPPTTRREQVDQTPVLAENSVVHTDVPYGGPDATLDVLDIYAPRDVKNAPVLLFFHGGEWSRGDKKPVASKPQFFNNHNVVFMSANYRLSPKDKHPAQVDDVATAIAWTKAHIADYGGDPGKIVIMGHSAGCHLVTLVSLDPEPLAKVHLKPSDIRGVISWSGGMFDLPARVQGGGMYPPFIKATFGDDTAAQRAASPMTYTANAKAAPPFLIASCDDDRSKTSRAASEEMIQQINQAGGKAEATTLAGRTHASALYLMGTSGDTTGKVVLDFIDKVTR